MAKQIYIRVFGIESGELQSWSSQSEKVLRDYGSTRDYATHLSSEGRKIKMIAWEHSEIPLLGNAETRLAACVKAIQECRTFEGWSATVPDCPELQEALREVGINIDLEPVGPRKLKPIVCPEIWHTKPFDPAEAWAATMQACKGGGAR